jgi:hypothetical protein
LILEKAGNSIMSLGKKKKILGMLANQRNLTKFCLEVAGSKLIQKVV